MDSPSTFPYGMKYGLISATVSLVIMFGLYAVNPELMFSAWQINLIGTIILIVAMVLAGLEFRKDNSGGASYGQAFSCSFFTFAVSMFVAMLGQYVLINVIDPSLIVLQQEVAIKAAVSTLEAFGADEDIIEQAITEVENQGTQTLAQMFTGYLFVLVIGVIVSTIIAAFTKKNRPIDFSDALNN